MQRLLLLTFTVLAVAPACGDEETDEPVAYSEVISLRMSGIKEEDIRDGQAAEDKNVNTEEGNPYAEFLRTAETRLGHEPSRIEVTSATLRIFQDTTGVNSFDEVFESMELFIGNNDTTIPVGTVASPTGTSITVPISADAADLDALQEDLATDTFKVGVRGPTVDSPPADFDLKISIEIQFQALP